MSALGQFSIVGLGPGDPDLITRKAARLIGEADVVAYHAGVRKSSHARRIAADLFPDGVIEEELRYPVTTGTTDHPGGYVGALADFYEQSAARMTAHLDAGRSIALLAEGDPLFYGSAMYLHDRLSPDYPTEVVPGVPAYAAATAALGTPLVRQDDVLTVLAGTLPEPELARRLADTDGAVIMKLGRTFPAVRRALHAAGRLDGAWYVERASMPEQEWRPVAEVDPATVPYFSLIVVPGDALHADRPGRMRDGRDVAPAPSSIPTPPPLERSTSELLVVGLGPGPADWLTPEASTALAEVEHVIGYAPYVDRVPQRPGLKRHASGNTVEVDRARHALQLARDGERVAVVSGGDAGVFGMAAAVFEAADDPEFADVPVRVLPGVTAIQAVAARAGAPIGADFAVLSLSDRLKPWDVIARRLRAIAEADLVLGIYNPASRSRRDQIVDARAVLLEHRSPDTVVIVGRDIGRTEESLTVTTLGDLDAHRIDMKCLLIIGATSTRVTAAGKAWTPRSVAAMVTP
ncbi:precorrin-3B C(17)-methyltransferase [Gordonia sp. (in: high G+C Gram-positive bacteria)]|uniref:precorrin-3B C(17)-methyltransferase n=1 Tax=Gordonia sp. (in: high G+C Gram-positive bacteria) TaxID=84139 RepID=UPI0016966B22|nr:precorrin-3B C(17)-methyltransferase [Gordonia sp. (in: high G+C Gram-positive bacteria)]NLG45771.1 precorrin-3B C(17)-methyltransferase [Gordonia sp. (in: high G+C Gram-positive bacteria)]